MIAHMFTHELVCATQANTTHQNLQQDGGIKFGNSSSYFVRFKTHLPSLPYICMYLCVCVYIGHMSERVIKSPSQRMATDMSDMSNDLSMSELEDDVDATVGIMVWPGQSGELFCTGFMQDRDSKKSR